MILFVLKSSVKQRKSKRKFLFGDVLLSPQVYLVIRVDFLEGAMQSLADFAGFLVREPHLVDDFGNSRRGVPLKSHIFETIIDDWTYDVIYHFLSLFVTTEGGDLCLL